MPELMRQVLRPLLGGGKRQHAAAERCRHVGTVDQRTPQPVEVEAKRMGGLFQGRAGSSVAVGACGRARR